MSPAGSSRRLSSSPYGSPLQSATRPSSNRPALKSLRTDTVQTTFNSTCLRREATLSGVNLSRVLRIEAALSSVSNSRELQTEAISSKHPREAARSSESAFSRDLRIEAAQNTLNIPREAALSSESAYSDLRTEAVQNTLSIPREASLSSVNTSSYLSEEGSSLVTNAAAIFRLDATGVPSVSFACSTRTADTPKLEFVHSIPEVSPGSLGQRGFSGQLRGPVVI
jgi:hypothetical protein